MEAVESARLLPVGPVAAANAARVGDQGGRGGGHLEVLAVRLVPADPAVAPLPADADGLVLVGQVAAVAAVVVERLHVVGLLAVVPLSAALGGPHRRLAPVLDYLYEAEGTEIETRLFVLFLIRDFVKSDSKFI